MASALAAAASEPAAPHAPAHAGSHAPHDRRYLLLLSLAWIIRLTEPLFNILGKDISGRDLVLIIGGLFLMLAAAVGALREAPAAAYERAIARPMPREAPVMKMCFPDKSACVGEIPG